MLQNPSKWFELFLKVNFKSFMDFIYFRPENSPLLPFTEKRQRIILYHSVLHLYRQLKKIILGEAYSVTAAVTGLPGRKPRDRTG